MNRAEGYQILTTYLKNPNLIKHSLAAEAAMKLIYKRLYAASYDPAMEVTWGITGLLHDADYEMSRGKPEVHGLLLFEKVKNKIPGEIEYAIKSHNYEYTKVMPQSAMDWAITCCDQLTGLIVAAALIHPDKKLASITSDFILNRFTDKSFAKGAKREPILLCQEKLGLQLKEFVDITLTAMQNISKDLGL